MSPPLRSGSADYHADASSASQTQLEGRRSSVVNRTVETEQQQEIRSRFFVAVESARNAATAIRRPTALTKRIEVEACDSIDSPAQPIATESHSCDDPCSNVRAGRDCEAGSEVESADPRDNPIEARLGSDFASALLGLSDNRRCSWRGRRCRHAGRGWRRNGSGDRRWRRGLLALGDGARQEKSSRAQDESRSARSRPHCEACRARDRARERASV